MADRVHPTPLLPLSSPPHPDPPSPDHHEDATVETAPLRAAGISYIVQVPKDQVLRVPPPDRARRYSKLAARPARRRMLRRACCGACCTLLALLVLAAAFVGTVYLVFRPRAPSFSVASLSVRGIPIVDLPVPTAAAAAPSPVQVQIDAAVRADNRANRKVGVDYRGGGEVSISYSRVLLATGRWPAFYQAPGNVTLVSMPLAGEGVALTEDQRRRMAAGAVPLAVEARVPVRVRFGKVLRTWTVDVWARCEVTVDKLAGEAALTAERGCRVKVKPLWWWW